jgi:hypothetical protein
MIHFSVSRRGSKQPYGEECPLGILRADARTALETAFRAIPREKKDRFESLLCNPRELSSSDPLVGVWFREGVNERFPLVLTITPFVESPGQTRVVVMGPDRMSRLGTARAGENQRKLIQIEGWPELEVEGNSQKLVLRDGATNESATYELNAYEQLGGR